MQVVTGLSAEDTILQPSSHVRHLYEGLFSHFFSTHRVNHSIKDCQWFLELVNKNVHWMMETKSQGTRSPDYQFSDERATATTSIPESSGCVPMSVYKLYLTRILGKAEVGTTRTNTFTSLTLYKPLVRLGLPFCLILYI